MCALRYIKVRLRNNCCRRKAISTTYFRARVCVCGWARGCGCKGAWGCPCRHVAVIIQHATRRRTVICGLSASTTFFDIIS